MSDAALGLSGFALLLMLLALRMPLALSLALVGGGGMWLLQESPWPLLQQIKTGPWFRFSSYALSVIPLFLLMGHIAARAGLSRALFEAARSWLGHFRGGMALAAIGACAGFGAVCGSSLATASTMARVALPELRRHGYDAGLSAGVLAAGGTLGILIPPSLVLVIYALLTEQNVAQLFGAALLPALLAVVGYMLATWLLACKAPHLAPPVAAQPLRQRLHSLLGVMPIVLIFLLVIGGIYLGWCTPTEAAALGTLATALLALLGHRMRRQDWADALLDTARDSAAIFLILLGAEWFNTFLALSGLPRLLVDWVGDSGLSALAIVALMLLCYLLLGCVMDSLSMILLTVPLFFPVLMGLELTLDAEQRAIWFGILTLVVVEVGLITPPVGLNVYLIQSQWPQISLLRVFAGVMPYLLADLVRIALLFAFPSLTLLLVA